MTDLHSYSETFDAAWVALEEAIVKVQALNDLAWGEDGELPEDPADRVPAVDASILMAKIRELKNEVETFDAAKAPRKNFPVTLPHFIL